MKIAIVYDPIYPYVIGGGEKRNWEIARRLVKKGHDVYLVGMKYWKGNNVIIKEGVHLVGVCPAVPFYNKKGRRSFFEPFYFGFFVFFHLLKNSYDIIDCGNFPYISCMACRLATLFKHTQLVITWHEVWGKRMWIDYAGKIGIIGWWIERMVARLTRYNIFVSLFMQERATNILKMKKMCTALIPNGIEFERMSSIGHIEKENQIIYVGRLVRHKRVDILIEAFEIVAKRFEDYKLKIAGCGPEREQLGSKVKDLKLEGRVIFVDFLERNELEKEIKRSKIFVLPSEREGMGIVIIESMTLGIPVIALDSEHSGAKSIIRNGENGILVKNKVEMSVAISELLTDKVLYENIVKNGLQTALTYDWDKSILPEIENYYKRILDER